MIGEIVASYRITAKIGEGGMGVVYKAEHTIMGKPAVIKVLRPNYSGQGEMVQRFFNEARAASSVAHPGIVDVFDLGIRNDGSAYIVMEFLRGESLAERLRRNGRLEVLEALELLRQMLGALAAAHAQGIVHRDLKPDNVFVIPDPELPRGERIKLLDFGIAKLVDAPSESADVITTRAGVLLGTPVYMSPEQCRGDGKIDHRADLYALGIIFFELVTGRPPFLASSAGELMAMHMRDAPPRLSERAGNITPELDHFTSTLLAKDPGDRFASASAAIQALDHASGGVFSTGGRSASSAGPRSSAGGRHEGAPTGSADPLAETAVGEAPAASQSSTTLGGSVSSLPAARRSKGGPALALAVLALVAAGTTGLYLSSHTADDAPSSAVARPAPPPAEESFDASTTTGATAVDAAAAPSTAIRSALAAALPPIDLAPVADSDALIARREHKRALDLHRAEDFEDAFVAYEAAIRADPGHIVARYNYACALNLAGQRDDGLAILAQLKEAGCPTCLGRIIRARSDSEWASAHSDPRFLSLTGDVFVEQPSPFESAQQVAAALSHGQFDALEPLFDPRATVPIKLRQASCKGKACTTSLSLRGYARVREWLETIDGPVAVGAQSCKSNCCTFAPATDAALSLTRMCTEIDSGSIRTISKLAFTTTLAP